VRPMAETAVALKFAAPGSLGVAADSLWTIVRL